MTRPAPIIAAILVALLLLFGAYMGSYYAMPSVVNLGSVTANRAIEKFYWPARKLDDLIWPPKYPVPDIDDLRKP